MPTHADVLQLSCRSTGVKDIAVWSVNNPHLTVAFERRAQGLLSVDCWVNISQLDMNNPIQDICKRGFTMPEAGEGLPFATGNLKFTLDGPGKPLYSPFSVIPRHLDTLTTSIMQKRINICCAL
jgi:hypothetical protein